MLWRRSLGTPSLLSLLAQQYPDFEVLALDDHSTDTTWQILTRLAVANARLHVIKGRPLPDDWLAIRAGSWTPYLETKAASLAGSRVNVETCV